LNIGQLLRVTIKQTYAADSTSLYNVMTYRCTDADITFDLRLLGQDELLTFFSGYWDIIRGIQATTLVYNSVLFENLNDWETEFKEYIPDVTLTGGVTSASMPTFNSFSFELLRTTRATRNGSKRIGCIPEAWITGNELTNTGGITAVNLAAATLGLGWAFTASGGAEIASFAPVITNKPIGHTPPTIINPVSDAAYRGIGTQNTRKKGRGI